MLKTGLFGGAAALALLSAPGVAAAQDPAALEARIAQLEAQLGALKAEVAASRPAPATAPAQAADVIRLPTAGQTPAAAPAAPPSSSASSDGFFIGSHTIKYGGFIKADAVASRYDGGDPANGDALRDFYLGGLDGYRIAFNDDFGQPLVPAKQHFRSETVDSQRGEAEWAGGNLYFDQWSYDFQWRVLPARQR